MRRQSCSSTASPPLNYGAADDKLFRVYPDTVKESFYSFAEQELSNLRDPKFIRKKIQPVPVEAVRRQVLLELYRYTLDPFFYVDVKLSTATSGTLALKVNGVIVGSKFGLKSISHLEIQLFDHLVDTEDDQMMFLLNSALTTRLRRPATI